MNLNITRDELTRQSIVKLKRKCKELKISREGGKMDIVNRIFYMMEGRHGTQPHTRTFRADTRKLRLQHRLHRKTKRNKKGGKNSKKEKKKCLSLRFVGIRPPKSDKFDNFISSFTGTMGEIQIKSMHAKTNLVSTSTVSKLKKCIRNIYSIPSRYDILILSSQVSDMIISDRDEATLSHFGIADHNLLTIGISRDDEPDPTPCFVESMDANDISTVDGYIRLICAPLLPSTRKIPMNITHIVLYYYCFTDEQYDGSIEEWPWTTTPRELRSRYLPLKRFHSDIYGGAYPIYEGKSTWYNHHKQIGFGDKIILKHINNPWRKAVSLLREMRILRELSGHPSIIALYDVLPSIFDSFTMIQTRMAANLEGIFRTNQYFSPLHVEYILYHILLGVKYIHDAGIVHCNLRPASILINADCSIKISSFDAACGVNEVIMKECQRWDIGDRLYQSPETILGYHPSWADNVYCMDMWVIGCIFAELLQMNKTNCVHVNGRRPTEPLKIIVLIVLMIGMPTDEDMEWMKRGHSLYVTSEVKKCPKGNPLDYDSKEGGKNLLKNLLAFDCRKRIDANNALKSTFFDRLITFSTSNAI
eukprot:34305_1